jgi:pyruvate,water dikinase
MTKEADELAAMDLTGLSDGGLAEETDSRKRTYDRWKAAYWRDCIPFAHGMRLFGQIYNDVMKPDDPFEFMELLRGGQLVSLKRNQKLEELASWIRRHPHLADRLRYGEPRDWNPEFRAAFDALCEEFGDLAWGQARFIQDPRGIIDLVIQMASRP